LNPVLIANAIVPTRAARRRACRMRSLKVISESLGVTETSFLTYGVSAGLLSSDSGPPRERDNAGTPHQRPHLSAVWFVKER
jgi:hypothetical protein